ncbi:MAG TPA: hypothetical protein VG891_08985 [Rhizomicrobium sp.]|nr:hypothetical protein [Rhizomicrobium sp.]
MARYPRCEHRANGNLTAGGSRSYTWTSFNMVATIAQGLVSEAFVYDSAHNRLKVCLPNCSSPTSTTTLTNGPMRSNG